MAAMVSETYMASRLPNSIRKNSNQIMFGNLGFAALLMRGFNRNLPQAGLTSRSIRRLITHC